MPIAAPKSGCGPIDNIPSWLEQDAWNHRCSSIQSQVVTAQVLVSEIRFGARAIILVMLSPRCMPVPQLARLCLTYLTLTKLQTFAMHGTSPWPVIFAITP